MFGKFFASTFTGSMCGAGAAVFAIWGYVIANTIDSQVELNPVFLAAILGMPQDEVAAAIAYLCQTDPRSRSKVSDGCRLIQEGQFAYRVPNHETYRRIANEEDRRDYLRHKKQEQRLRDRKQTVNQDVNNGQPPSTMSTHTEAEAEAETKIKTLSSDSPNGNPKPAPDLTPVFEYYIQKANRNPRTYLFTPARQKKVAARFAECLKLTSGDEAKAIGLLKVAVDGLTKSRFHMGENDQQKKYCDFVDHLFFSWEKMERWLNA
jgi:hypothetical protein